MDYVDIRVGAGDSDNHTLVYVWTITEDPTGKAYFFPDSTKSLKTVQTIAGYVDVGFPWVTEATAASLVGSVVKFEVRVKHENAQYTEEAVAQFTVTISGVNRSPVPNIKQSWANQWGSPANRLVPGDVVSCSSDGTTDPDGAMDAAGMHMEWGLGVAAGFGRYLQPIAIIGSEGTSMSFTIPGIANGTIDQEVILRVINGLHEPTTSIIAYLGPAGSTPPPVTGNSAPTVSVTTPVNVTVGQTVTISGTVDDADGDDLDFSWTYLEGSGSASNPAVIVTGPTVTGVAKRWQVSANLGSFSTVQTRHYRLTARERSTTDRKTGQADVTVNVATSPGTPGTSIVSETTSNCGSGNAAPTVTFSPDARTTVLTFQGGQQVAIEVTGMDVSEKSVGIGIAKGIGNFVWTTTSLTNLGVQVPAPTIEHTVGGDPTKSKSTLRFTAPDVNNTANVTVAVLDVLDCTRTITFKITFIKSAASNQAPVPKIQYKKGSDAYANAPAVGTAVNIDTTAAVTITLNAGTSTDDGGAANLTFAWTKTENITAGSGTTFTPSGTTATLALPAGSTGTVTVTLQATDLQGANASTTITFAIGPPVNGTPVAKIKYKIGSGTLQDAPASAVAVNTAAAVVITLDASGSTDDKGLANLVFLWTKTENMTAGSSTLSATSGQSVTVNVPADAAGRITITLKATDQQGANHTATAIFDVAPPPNATPVAKIKYKIGSAAMQDAPAAGTPVNVDSTTAVSIALDATGSTDDGGLANLTFQWSKTDALTVGSGVTLSAVTGQTVTLTIPLAVAGTVTISLKATDQKGANHTVTVVFGVTKASNAKPVLKVKYKIGTAALADVPANGAIAVDSKTAVTVTLDSGSTTDDDGLTNVTFAWTKTESLSSGSALTMSPSAGQTTTLNIGQGTRGSVAITVTATDKYKAVSTLNLTITIENSSLQPAVKIVVKVGGNTLSATDKVEEGANVTLDGSQTARGDGTKVGLVFLWTQLEGPAVGLIGVDKSIANFTAPAVKLSETSLKFKLEVTDPATGMSDRKEVVIIVIIPANFFAQMAVGPSAGDEYYTILLLVNNNGLEEPALGVVVEFFAPDGSVFVPECATWDGTPFDIPAQSSKRLEFTGSDLRVGWARVKSRTRLTGLLSYQVVGLGRSGLKEVKAEIPVLASGRGKQFATYCDVAQLLTRIGQPGPGIAVAVANPGTAQASVMVRIKGHRDGKPWEIAAKNLFLEEEGILYPKCHGAKFINVELLGILPSSFREGTLVIEADEDVIVTVLKTKDGFPFATLPVAGGREPGKGVE